MDHLTFLCPRYGLCHIHEGRNRLRNRSACCSGRQAVEAAVSRIPADLVDWPAGRRPASGNVTRTALAKLKVEHLKSELVKREIETTGKKKQDLVDSLLNVLQEELAQEGENGLGNCDGDQDKSFEGIQPSASGISVQTSLGSAQSTRSDEHSDITWIKNPNNDKVLAVGGITNVPDCWDEDAQRTFLLTNKAGIQLVFLGTSAGAASPDRALPSMVFRNNSDIWLFNVGEDTQRQMLKHPIIKPSKITRLFVTSLSPDLVHGIPGMICTVSASREKGHVSADKPVHIYGPSGLAVFIETTLAISQTYLEIPVIIHEFSNTRVAHGFQLEQLSGVRWRLWRSIIPPDAVTPQGWYDAELESVMPVSRQSRVRKGKRYRAGHINSRSGFRKLDLPGPGDPSSELLGMSEAIWTLKINDQFKISVVPLKAKVPSVAYFIQEADRAGSLDVKRAKALGVMDRKFYGILKRGGTVRNKHGRMVPPNLAVSPDWRGRRILVVGKSNAPAETLRKHEFNKLDALIMPLTHKPASMDRDMLVREEALQLSEELQAAAVFFNQVEHSEDDSEGTDVSKIVDEKGMREPVDLYTHILEPRPPPPVAPITDEMLRDLGF